MSTLQSNKIQVLNQLLMVGLEVNIWSARKKLREEDLGNDLQLPPAELASLGSKRIIDPDLLKPFETLKRRAVRLLQERGTQFMGAYAIPEAIAGEVAAELESIEREFADAKSTFLAAYDQSCNEWINRPWAKPEWREAICRAITPKAVVEARLGYRFSLCRVLPDDSAPILSKGLEREVQGLSGQLFREIADEAEDICEKTLRGATSVTQKTVNRIWKMHSKLTSLAFLAPEVQGLADFLAKQLLALPNKGKLEGSEFKNLFSMVLNLSDETKIATLADVYDSSAQIDFIVDDADADADADAVVEADAGAGAGAEEFLVDSIAPVVSAELCLDVAQELIKDADEEIELANSQVELEEIEQVIDMAKAAFDHLPDSPSTFVVVPEINEESFFAPVPAQEGVFDFCM
jgi:hypothetical protein